MPRLTLRPRQRIAGQLALLAMLAAALAIAPRFARAEPAPPVAPIISVTGNVFDPFSRAPLGGVEVAFHALHGDQLLARATADAAGVYRVSLATKGKPLDVYVRATAAGRAPTLLYPPEPLTSDLVPCPPFAGTTDCILIAMLTPAEANQMASFAGVSRDPARGEALFIAADCAGRPVAGATVAFSRRPERLSYTRGPLPDLGAHVTDASGRVFGFNIAPGPVTMRVRYPNGDTAISHVLIEPGAITIASALPQNARCGR